MASLGFDDEKAKELAKSVSSKLVVIRDKPPDITIDGFQFHADE